MTAWAQFWIQTRPLGIESIHQLQLVRVIHWTVALRSLCRPAATVAA